MDPATHWPRSDVKILIVVTAAVWLGAVGLYMVRLLGRRPLGSFGSQRLDLLETGMLAASALGWQIVTLTLGARRVGRTWQSAVLDGRSGPDVRSWRTCAWAGIACWSAAGALAAPVACGCWPQMTGLPLVFGLIILLIPAVHCSAAAIVTPRVARRVAERVVDMEEGMRVRLAVQAVRPRRAILLAHAPAPRRSTDQRAAGGM